MRIYKAKQLYGPGGITGLSKGRFYLLRKKGENDEPPNFPDPNIVLSDRFRAWTSDIVEAWIESKRNDKPTTWRRGEGP